MPIYEFACPKCRRIFSFLSKRVNPDRTPVCPKCGSNRLEKQLSGFAMLKGTPEPSAVADSDHEGPPSDPAATAAEDAKMERVMSELERDMDHLDENNPRHVAHLMRKMKDVLPAGATPKELEIAIRRLEQGEDPEKIEADMGDVLGGLLGGDDDPNNPGSGTGSRGGGYSRDSGLYDY